MRVLFLPTKTLICGNKRNHNFILYTLTKIVKIRRRRLTDQGRSQDFLRGTHNSPKLLCTSLPPPPLPSPPHLPAQLLCTSPIALLRPCRQLVMSRNSSRIKASRKTEGRLLLSYKKPDFFSGLSELYRIFFKNDGVYGGWSFFFIFFFFINFVCLCVARKTPPARS